MLLPRQQQPPEEDAEEDDPRWELIRQLIEYKKFKDAAGFLQQRAYAQESLFPANPETQAPRPGPPPMPEVGIFDLIRAFQNVVTRFRSQDLETIVDDRWTVADKIEHILQAVPHGVPVTFVELFSQSTSRDEVIVTFIALLELMKLRQLRVTQDHLLGEIVIFRNDNA
jgi:segregation and condensation protein A